MHSPVPDEVDTLSCTAMTRKLVVLAALILLALSVVFAQVPVPLPSTTSDVSTPLEVGGNVLPPKLISSVEPKYPRPLFHKPKPSNVIVGVTIPIDGIPTNIHIVKSGGATFDKSALKAVSQYRFQPSTLYGKPVSTSIKIEVEFMVF